MTRNSSKYRLSSLLVLIPTVGVMALPSIASANVDIECTIPNHVVCEISSPKGIKSVRITSNTPFGVIDLVNEDYGAECPKNVSVHWDSAYHSSSQVITECSSIRPDRPSGFAPSGLKL